MPLDIPEAVRQLELIRRVEGISAVCFLTGEYVEGGERNSTILAISTLVGEAFQLGFEKVYVNIGALSTGEIGIFADQYPRDERLVLSLFQETYDRNTYRRVFGKAKRSNPKGDFDLRFTTMDRWLQAGFVNVDVGILVGLGPFDQDLSALIDHAAMLRARGASIAVSLPRLRGIEIVPFPVNDEEYGRAIRRVAESCPWAKIILTTRESLQFIRSMLPYIGIVAPGTSDVLPYTAAGPIPNRRETSQFVVATLRPRPRWTLEALGLPRGSIKYFCGGS